ncbi:MAG: GAF domain-containing protein [Betaproteobacteria bacterium]|nr:MAG: GAF domain-containing protein [Betaproteobacteria bacterium]
MKSDFSCLTPLGACGRFELLRGRRTSTGASVLLKRCRETGADPGPLRREFAIASALSSAVTLLPRMVESPPPAAMLMEDPGGEVLSERLKSGALAVDVALSVGLQVAATLAELHGQGIVHRGIRPDTILLGADGSRAWLIDFSQASPSPIAPHSAQPLVATGSPAYLTYLSPELTGRLDCGVDQRSDLYSLGVVLYELLTGAPPFQSKDALEVIHWHIAGIPRAPSSVDPAIPEVVSELVMKLLAKTPEERYQGARALSQDLATCLRDWSAHRQIAPFELGRTDIGERLVISSKLYGREREVHTLLQAFEQACLGRSGGTLLLVEGYSGIGKTALIQQLYKPIVRRKGYFLSGKFDQVARGVPFGALIQAFRGLVRQLLTESETQLASWREKLGSALGSNGGVLVAVMPELEFIVGAQPIPIELGSIEAQNRFQRVIQNFVAALAQPEHPLVLFLDDLQWADAATLGLLAPLLTSSEIRGTLLMGAYRDHELDASPHLARALTTLAAGGITLNRISLGPLRLADLNQLVADTLQTGASDAAPLARLVLEKTGGNPFFVIEFLKLLEREGHLQFDGERGRWVYGIEQIAGLPLTDNVIDLMTRRIQQLPPNSQYALTLAACIGNRFDRKTLAIVIEQSPARTAEDLEPAIAEGLIVKAAAPIGGGSAVGIETPEAYAFLHDRVQQSAYALIPADRRQMVHLTVGRLLRSGATTEQLGPALFEVVHHLNLGRSLVHDTIERRDLATLNLAAGRRAKSSTAHDTALQHFLVGAGLIDAAEWTGAYELIFDLHLEAAESLYLCGQFDNALSALDTLTGHARSAIDLARVARLRSVQYENLAKYAEALASAREGLALLGVSFPDEESKKQDALEREIAQIDSLRGGREIAALVDLPTMTDPQHRMVMVMLTDIWSAAYILGDATLARLISATLVRLSLTHGNIEESAYGYVTHAITVGPVRGEYAAAYEFGRLALAVNRRFEDARRRAKIYQQFHAHVNFWCQPFSTCLPYAREAFRSGLESGDFLYAAYGAGTELWAAIVATQDLARFVRDYSPSVALIEKLKNTGFADSVRLILNWVRALQGRTVDPLSLTDETLDEDAYVRTYGDNPFFGGIHAVARLHLTTLLGSPQQALQAAQRASPLVAHMPGTVWPLICDFWHGIALAANIDRVSADERTQWLVRLKRVQTAYQTKSAHCAENFLSQAQLLEAEIARIEGRDRDAIALYAEAIEFTSGRPLIPYRALAHELLGRHYLQRGQNSMASIHLARARECYARWGADAKSDAMARQYPILAPAGHETDDVGSRDPQAPHPAGSIEPAAADLADGLDLFSVIKATQAIAGEIELQELFARLLHITIENAGAERGALILETESGPIVHAGAAIADAQANPEDGIALERSQRVPAGIVNYVRRTGDDVVLARADADEQYGNDPYVARHRPRSVACLPVQRQGRTIGVLYLEHRRAAAIFTHQRLRTLRVLAAQAVASLESARLFDVMKRDIEARRQAQEQLSTALAQVEQLCGSLEAENSYLRRDLIANVSHDLRTPLASMRGYLELLSAKSDSLRPDQRDEYLGIAVRQSEHLATLIDELFELAKLDFKGMTLEREAFSLAELAADVLQKFRLAAESKRIELRLEAVPHPPFVRADLGLIERVLDNLISNAIRQTPPGGQVCVRLHQEGHRHFAQVSDSGPGIPSAELPFIFDRFYRGANGRTGTSGGAELGLAITKRILELHETTIEVQSDEKSGTRFTFSLPLQGALSVPA